MKPSSKHAERLRVVDDFFPETQALRAHFDERFADPRRARGDRFVWDYWHVPGQYTALRTPAWEYFPKPLYNRLHHALVAYGREHLGCHDISPPWMSVYVEGCRQELHGDLPHGPFAFVYSLTHWKERVFEGGETLLLRDSVLDHWSDFTSTRGVELGEVIEAIAPELGRLTVFDPRIPHGVKRVEGTHDPREGRLVIHGWFVQPRPFLEGPLPESALEAAAAELGVLLGTVVPEGAPLAGLLSLRFTVAPDGSTSTPQIVANTVRVPANERALSQKVITSVRRFLAGYRFPKRKRPSTVTLPLVFER